ncbi:hypothetical protein [Sporomusa malonica]|uniref:Uncharacterized protein n=1 Tax=Sporomusa malonica TaxID=112901 RepID=A0A1W1ZN96_9FIRM|nr:hypothetical protein [Sporomusa malonica]SMC50005.1 hypothetical protein SAMN04488500_10484 [Sporomusa malonica]
MNTTILDSICWLKELASNTNKTVQTILRILAAVFGGYVLTASALAALALLLPWPKPDVLFFSALFPALIYPAVLLWIFAAPTAQRAWRDLAAATLFCGVLALTAAWAS